MEDWIINFFLLFVRSYAFLFVIRASHVYLGQSGILVIAVAMSVGGVASQNLSTNIFHEVLKGIILGAPFSFLAEALGMTGRIIDVSRGAQFAEQLNPYIGERVSPLETFAMLLVFVIAFPLGGYQEVLRVFYNGVSSSVDDGMLLNRFVQLSSDAIRFGVFAAAPVMVSCFLFDIGGALMCRAMARINVLFELLPLKALLGVFMAALMLRLSFL